jgi:Snf7
MGQSGSSSAAGTGVGGKGEGTVTRTPHEVIAEKVAALEKMADTQSRRLEALQKQNEVQRATAVRCQKEGKRDGRWIRAAIRGRGGNGGESGAWSAEALLWLRRSKLTGGQIDALRDSQLKVHRLALAIDSMVRACFPPHFLPSFSGACDWSRTSGPWVECVQARNRTAMELMEKGSKLSKVLYRDMDAQTVSELLDDLADEIAHVQEVQDAVSSAPLGEESEDTLLRELDAAQASQERGREDGVEERGRVGSAAVVGASAAAAAAVPAHGQSESATGTADLPAPPTAPPTVPTAEEEPVPSDMDLERQLALLESS